MVLANRRNDAPPSSVKPPEHVFIGRQPLLDEKGRLWGYKLLYRRDDQENAAQFSCPLAATTNVVMNMIAELGVEKVVGQHKMLITCPAEALTDELLSILPQEKVVLEIPIEASPANDNASRLAEIAKAGFQLAAQGRPLGEQEDPSLKFAKFVKFDISAFDKEGLKKAIGALGKHDAVLIAERIETKAQVERCKKLGFTLFQGYYFCKPEIIKGKRAPANQMAIIRLLSQVNDPDCPRERLIKLITDEVSLSFRLLRTLNSAAYGFVREVQTIEHAVSLLGEVRLRQWVSMLVVSKIPNKPSELSRTALLRANMCEHIARETMRAEPRSAFTVGLFSVLDTMMDTRMSSIVRELPLDKAIAAALLRRESPLTEVLDTALCYESGNWEKMPLCLPSSLLTGIWIEATRATETAFAYMVDQP